MSYDIGDGYDFYSQIGDGIGGNQWDAGSTAVSGSISTVTRFGTGRSFQYSNGSNRLLIKSGLSNQATRFCSTAYYTPDLAASSSIGFAMSFFDNGAYQCMVCFNRDLSIQVFSGDFSTLQATFPNAQTPGAYDLFKIRVDIHNTAGAVRIRKGNATSDTFVATNINTRGGSANNYCNGVGIRSSGATGINAYLDDTLFYCNDGVYPTDWLGDVRYVQLPPTLDTAQKQFTQNSSGSLVNFGQTDASSHQTYSGGTIHTCSIFSISQGGSFTAANVQLNANFTGHMKLALYLADGNSAGFASDSTPGTLVAVSNEVTNPTAGANAFTFPSTVPVMKGFGYFFALQADGVVDMNSSFFGANCYQYVTTYGAGFPTSLAGLASFTITANPAMWVATLTATNAGCVNDETQDGLGTYLSDSVVGHKDLFDLKNLDYDPAFIVGLTFQALIAKSDAGGKTARLIGQSGATAFETGDFNPLTSFGPFNTFYPVDPNTTVAWTTAAVNALQAGQKVQA